MVGAGQPRNVSWPHVYFDACQELGPRNGPTPPCGNNTPLKRAVECSQPEGRKAHAACAELELQQLQTHTDCSRFPVAGRKLQRHLHGEPGRLVLCKEPRSPGRMCPACCWMDWRAMGSRDNRTTGRDPTRGRETLGRVGIHLKGQGGLLRKLSGARGPPTPFLRLLEGVLLTTAGEKHRGISGGSGRPTRSGGSREPRGFARVLGWRRCLWSGEGMNLSHQEVGSLQPGGRAASPEGCGHQGSAGQKLLENCPRSELGES